MHSLGLAGMAAAWRDIAEQDSAGDLTRNEWLGLCSIVRSQLAQIGG